MIKWWRRWGLVALILGLALVLRLLRLNESLGFTEAAQALHSAQPLDRQLQLTTEFQPPLFYLLIHIAFIFGHAEWWLRLVGAVIPGLLTVWGTYLLGRKLSSRKVGAMAALLLATSSFHIYFSGELRPYALTAALAVWSWLLLLEAERIGQDIYQLRRGNALDQILRWLPFSRDVAFYLILTIAGLYTSYLYVLVYASQGLFLLTRKKWRVLCWSVLIPVVACLPWWSTFCRQLQTRQTLMTTFPGMRQIGGFSSWKLPLLTASKFLYGVVDVDFSFAWLVLTAIFASLVGAVLVGRPWGWYKREKQTLAVFGFFLLVPLILASLVSVFITIMQPRRVIYLLPFVYLLLSFLVLGRRRDWRSLRLTHWLLLAFLLAANLWGTKQYYTKMDYRRENWRAAVALLHRNYSPTQTVVVFPYGSEFAPWRWYERDCPEPFRTLVTGTYDTSMVAATLPDILRPVENYRYAVVFDYWRALTDRENLIPQTLVYNDFVPDARVYAYPNLGAIRVYAKDESRF